MTRYDLIKGMPVETFVDLFGSVYSIDKCKTCNGKKDCKKCLTEYLTEEIKIEFVNVREDGTPITKEEILTNRAIRDKVGEKTPTETYNDMWMGLYDLYVDYLAYSLLQGLLEKEDPLAEEDDVEEL